MPTTDVTNTLVANISSTEQSTSNVPINRSTGNPSFASNSGSFVTYVALAAGVNVPFFPFSPITQVYVRNIDAAKSLSMSWVPNGGAAAVVIELNPGDQIILWSNPAGPVAPGITSISFTPSTSGCLIEYFFGG